MQSKSTESDYEKFETSSYLDGNSAAYVDGLYEMFLHDPQSVPAEWMMYFQSLSAGEANIDTSHADIRSALVDVVMSPHQVVMPAVSSKQASVDALINAFRRFGHLSANINPLQVPQLDRRLTLSFYELQDSDLQVDFLTRGVLPQVTASLRDIHAALQLAYCQEVGFQCEHIEDEEERAWLQNHVENILPALTFTAEEKQSILNDMTQAEGLEKYLDVKYPGQKRFSNEGLDSLIPMMKHLNSSAASYGVKEIKIGMAHRGRINVLVNIMGQPSQDLFSEFDGTKDYGLTSGDVKYHRGHSSDVMTPSGPLHLTLAFNPSHLEFINTVVMGSTRARQEHHYGDHAEVDYAMAVMLHGDAAFAGQGVVMETLAMANTRAYTLGGSIHIVLNNQVGFTTSEIDDSRSSRYCSGIAKMINAPIFHVNADFPEQAMKIAKLACDYRHKFKKDVVIDLVGFRRHGHQEVDEPRATQPVMYQKIDTHPGARTLYAKKLIASNVVAQKDVDRLWIEFRDKLDAGKQVVSTLSQGLSEHYATSWTPYLERNWTVQSDTSVDSATVKSLGQQLETLPEGFSLQRNVSMIMKNRNKMTAGEMPIDWGYAETMAYASLVHEGVSVRLAGEDCERGTFFHRQAMLHDQKTGEKYMPLQNIVKNGARIDIYNSLLSEAGALGFEYGYTIADPNALVIWEAQFGDFANGAQVIIDQFISSGWQKWNRLSGLVMLLPHGYEGMGPEHSSARLERYMQLCAQENIQVCVPSTPGQIFHLLRRQVLRPYRKPLVVMSPKSLLRHKLAVSSLDDLSSGHFHLVISEQDDLDLSKVTRVVACSGKVYYDLLQKRRDENIDNIAIIRVEQLYPFPYQEFARVLGEFPNATELVWCQEEPKNQGAWFITRGRLVKSKPSSMQMFYSCRPPSAAPAAGYPALAKSQQAELVSRALGLDGLTPFADDQ
jgi:2-oxoglutarate dehydrogenase E1 component